jgi:RHS repeat-associated protein
MSDFGYTGELTDPNGLVYLRARYYNPSLGVFPSLDPLENGNRYVYVNGNVTNLTDLSGLTPICSSRNSESCALLHSALRRASEIGLGYLGEALRRTDDAYESLDFFALRVNVRREFGVSVAIGNYSNGATSYDIDLPYSYQCIDDVIHPSLRNRIIDSEDGLVKLATALVHIVSKVQEAGIGNGISLFKTKVGQYLTAVLRAEGVTTNGGPMPNNQGLAPVGSAGNTVYLGSDIAMFAIVHELGHIFDYKFGQSPSLILKNLVLSGINNTHVGSGIPYYGVPDNDISLYYNNFDTTSNSSGVLSDLSGGPLVGGSNINSSYGFSARAALESDYDESIETWADAFMTWVLDKQETDASGYGYNPIGWNTSSSREERHQKFLEAYVKTTMSGALSGDPLLPNEIAEYLPFVLDVLLSYYDGDYIQDVNNIRIRLRE